MKDANIRMDFEAPSPYANGGESQGQALAFGGK